MFRRTLLTGAAATAAPPLASPARRLARSALRAAVRRDLARPGGDHRLRHDAPSMLVWDQLYGLDAQLRPQPQMVEGHTLEEDGRRWTFRLRDGLRFHDGEPVRGRDCAASIRRWAQRDPLGQVLLERMAEMSAPDDRSFVSRLHRPYGLMLDALAKPGPPALFVMPERLAATDPAQQIREIVGSGPFRFRPDERVVGARGLRAQPGLRAAGRWHRRVDRRPEGRALRPGGVDGDARRRHRNRGAAQRRGGLVGEPDQRPAADPGARPQRHGGAEQPAGSDVHRCVQPPARALRQAGGAARGAAGDVAGGLPDRDRRHRPDAVAQGGGRVHPGHADGQRAGLGAVAGGGDVISARQALAAAGYQGERVVLLAPSDNPVPAASSSTSW